MELYCIPPNWFIVDESVHRGAPFGPSLGPCTKVTRIPSLFASQLLGCLLLRDVQFIAESLVNEVRTFFWPRYTITFTIHLCPLTFATDIIHNFWLGRFQCALYCYAQNYVILKSLVSPLFVLSDEGPLRPKLVTFRILF